MSQQALAERQVVLSDGRAYRTEIAVEQSAMGRIAENAISLASPLLILLVWELLVRLGFMDARFFPAPSHVAGTFAALIASGELFAHVGASLVRSLVGFTMGAIPGVLLGLSMGLFPITRAAIWPTIGALYPIPKIAILPLVMLMFGIGETSKWVIIAIAVFFPALINSMAGVMSIERIYHDVGRNYGASRLSHYLTIALPGALPLVMTGLRLGWGIALLVIVAAEFVAANAGLGYLIWASWQTFNVEAMYVGIIVIAILGYFSFLILDEIGKLLVPWKPGGVA